MALGQKNKKAQAQKAIKAGLDEFEADVAETREAMERFIAEQQEYEEDLERERRKKYGRLFDYFHELGPQAVDYDDEPDGYFYSGEDFRD
jgi:predicted nuclease with TOPRIM domain